MIANHPENASVFNSRHKVVGHLFQGRYKTLNVEEGEAGYFQILSIYIHLNPVRAELVRAGEQALKRYRWSSYPFYLAAAAKRPAWLRACLPKLRRRQVERVLGSVGIGADDSRGRRGYEAWTERRVGEWCRRKSRSSLEAEWQGVRRGGYLGDTGEWARPSTARGRNRSACWRTNSLN